MERVAKGDKNYNFICMAAGGKFLCRDEKKFWKALERGKRQHAYVPKIDKDLPFKPCIVDVDMILTKDQYMRTEDFKLLYFDPLLNVVKGMYPKLNLNCTVMRRPFLVKKKMEARHQQDDLERWVSYYF